MPTVSEIVTLTVDGSGLQGWQGVHISRSAKAAAISFSLAATNPAWSAEAKALRMGKLIQIYTTPDAGLGSFGGGDLACTGYVDDYEVQIGKLGHREVALSGRSKAGDAIDCPPAKHKTGLVENKDLKGVAEEFDEFGIGFTTDQKLKKIPMVQMVPGQSMFVSIEREARRQALLLTGQADGSVKITRAGSNRHAGALVEGEAPAESFKVRFSIKDKRSPVVVRGQTSLGTGKAALRQEERDEDNSVERHRPIIIFNEGSNTAKELKERAQWERLRRSGSGVSITACVSTWRDDAGKLWEPGYLLAVKVPSEDVDQDLAIKTVEFHQVVGEGEGTGTWADLTLVEPRTLGGKASSGGSPSEELDAGSSVDDEGQGEE